MQLTDLPTDIIVLVFPYLSASDFLSFTSITKTFLTFRQEPTFWRTLTTRTFRIPPQPLLQADGPRWQWLYKSLFTQTRAFTWGNNSCYNLGHSVVSSLHQPRLALGNHNPSIRQLLHVGWPTEMEHMEYVGVIADIQCGGWSTILLNSEGQLFFVGVLDGQRFQQHIAVPTLLSFPPAYPSTKKEHYEPTTAIRQYSVGRRHVVGLSDSGKIWEWTDNRFAGRHVKFASVDVAEGSTTGKGSVTRVVAGWAGSSAYINGTGIVFWKMTPEFRAPAETDGFLVDSMTIPGTSFRRRQAEQFSHPSHGSRIGEVINHVVLDNHIVFITHLNKVFAYPANLDDFDPDFVPVEITTFSQGSPQFVIEDIQGSFRNFGVFSKNGAVLLGNTTLLEAFINASHAVHPPTTNSLPRPTIPRALQNASVISLAFGDYHYHALHTNGTISSYGHESQRCGSLGLGSPEYATGRGVDYFFHHHHADGVLDRPDWTDGRTTVWFEDEKYLWLKSIVAPGVGTVPHGLPRLLLLRQPPTPQATSQIYSEWIEQEGRKWHLGPQEYRANNPSSVDNDPEDDKGAYFALKVTAAGWHSGALILVDSAKAERVRQKYIVPPTPEPIQVARPLSTPGNQDRGPRELLDGTSGSSLEQLSQAVTACGRWLYESGRWFLGLTARDEMIAQGLGNQGENESSKVKEEKTTWVWEGKALPKLRLIGGSVVPVGGEVVDWRDGQPDW